MMKITVNNVPKDITTIAMEMATDWSHQPPYRICRNQRAMHDDGDFQSHHRLHTQRSRIYKVSTL